MRVREADYFDGSRAPESQGQKGSELASVLVRRTEGERVRKCPSAEERSDVSTRAQCRGQGATPPPMVCGAELGDDHVDLITFSWISVSLIQSRGGLPSHKQSEIFDPRCQSQKFAAQGPGKRKTRKKEVVHLVLCIM